MAPFPATTASTACALGLLTLVLQIWVGAGRAKYRTGLGDGGHDDLTRRIRIHANLIENAPLFLILLGLTELSGAAPALVRTVAAFFVVCRLVHVYGLSLAFGPGPNWARATGAGGSALGMLVLIVTLTLQMLA